MAKSSVIKFPRVTGGFYQVTKDGELVGYIMKEESNKEINWYIFDNATPDLDVAMLHPDTSIDAPDGLLREAKDSAKAYFMNKPVAVVEPVVEIAAPDWSESEEEEEVAIDSAFDELMGEDDDYEDEDEEIVFTDDELKEEEEDLEDDFSYESPESAEFTTV